MVSQYSLLEAIINWSGWKVWMWVGCCALNFETLRFLFQTKVICSFLLSVFCFVLVSSEAFLGRCDRGFHMLLAFSVRGNSSSWCSFYMSVQGAMSIWMWISGRDSGNLESHTSSSLISKREKQLSGCLSTPGQWGQTKCNWSIRSQSFQSEGSVLLEKNEFVCISNYRFFVPQITWTCSPNASCIAKKSSAYTGSRICPSKLLCSSFICVVFCQECVACSMFAGIIHADELLVRQW